MITGFGLRISGETSNNGTHSYILNSKDASGAKYVITTKDGNENDAGKYDHFSSKHVDRYYNS